MKHHLILTEINFSGMPGVFLVTIQIRPTEDVIIIIINNIY